ncbi:MAG: citrate synthase [Chthoniobacterales bacterium]|nr:citrate synthase [Chthoniobacterales bacterium]
MPINAKGLEGIIANATSLSDVRGQEGRLIYQGYNIDELAGKVSFEEVIHLLWYGTLPTAAQLLALHQELANQRELPQGVIDFLQRAPRNAAPIDVIRTAISMLGLYDKEGSQSSLEKTTSFNHQRAASITAKISVIAAYYHRARQGKELPPINKELGEAEHFLYLLEGKMPTQEAIETLDVAYVLHADHGMNASTFSARVTISTLTDIYSAITSAIGTLKGPLHGGANEGVVHMLQEIGEEANVDSWITKALAQKKKIMGIGHRVYKTLDPRAPHLRAMAMKLSQELGDAKWIRMAEQIAVIMKERKGLNANVDFYSAIVYYSLGLPTDMFTPVFSIARTAGWTAHILEQLADNRIYRPLSEYVGPAEGKKIVPIALR